MKGACVLARLRAPLLLQLWDVVLSVIGSLFKPATVQYVLRAIKKFFPNGKKGDGLCTLKSAIVPSYNKMISMFYTFSHLKAFERFWFIPVKLSNSLSYTNRHKYMDTFYILQKIKCRRLKTVFIQLLLTSVNIVYSPQHQC